MLGVVGLFYGAYFFVALFACRTFPVHSSRGLRKPHHVTLGTAAHRPSEPIEYTWERYNPIPPSGKCNAGVAATAITYIATFMNIVADWGLAILPATVVWQAKLSRRTKISISLILAIGSM